MERKELIDVVVVQLHDTMILTTRKILPPFCACAHSSGTLFTGGQYLPVNNVQGDIIYGGTLFTLTPCMIVKFTI